MKTALQEDFGNIDIYLFDQLLKGRFDKCHTVLDLGCGNGRNLAYFLKNNFQVYAIDQLADSIREVKLLASRIAPHLPSGNFQVISIEQMPFEDNWFDIVLSSAVFHFAKNESHFDAMLKAAWRVLKPGGFLFVRLASDIGIEEKVIPLGDRRFRLPDGSDRFLVNEQMLLEYTKLLNGELYEEIKTTIVRNQRCMTTWCVRKN
jgi:tellurite methyltransferase